MSNTMLGSISEQLHELDKASRDEEAEKILTWISPTSFRLKQADMLEGVQPGTGSWFLQHPDYRSWVQGNVDRLWCPGIRES
jgi:hypothetical protein